MTSLATAMMSAALFSRKSRSGWLDELDGIRGDALVSPDGEVDVLMQPVDRLADTGLDGPIEWRDADLTPAPHRANPAEMWHPEVVVPPVEEPADAHPDLDVPEEVVDPEDLLLPSGRPTGFRFSTFSTGERLHVDDGLTIPQPVGEPVIDDEVAWSPRSAALPPAEPAAMGEPLPITFVPEGGTGFEDLVAEPVGRRTPDAHDRQEVPARVRPLDLPDLATPAAAPIAAPAPAPTSVLDELVPVVPAVAQSVPVDDDGTVVLSAGLLRLGPGVRSEVRHDSGRIRVELANAWCWATLGADSEPVTISLPSGTLALDPGTTALVTVEPDDSAFVAVASGSAVLVEANGPTPLPGGSLALAPVGAPAQVDLASPGEIDADPLVAHNRELDADL